VGTRSLFSRQWALRIKACCELVWLRHAGGNVHVDGSILGQWYMHACFNATLRWLIPTPAHVAMSLQPLGNANSGARKKYHKEGIRTIALSMPNGRLAAPKPGDPLGMMYRPPTPGVARRGILWKLVGVSLQHGGTKVEAKMKEPFRNRTCEVYLIGILYRPWLLRSNRTRHILENLEIRS
jgi:hypothetical protein